MSAGHPGLLHRRCLVALGALAAGLLPAALRAEDPGKPLPGVVELMDRDGFERSAALIRLCREAGPEQMDVLLKVASEPSLASRHYGEVALALARLATDEHIPEGLELTEATHPIPRYLGVVVVAAPGAEASRQALLGRLQAKAPDVRAAAALALRHWPDDAVATALRPLAQSGETASERSCAAAAIEWIESIRQPGTVPVRRVVAIEGLGPRAVHAAQGPAILFLSAASHALSDPDRTAAVLARLKAGSTLWVSFDKVPAAPPPALAALMDRLGLDLPLPTKGNAAPFVCNGQEPHPLQDTIHDLAAGRVSIPEGDRDAGAHLTSEIARWSVPADTGFSRWDPKRWSAPFCAADLSGRACILDAPPTSDRGRVLLDTTGMRIPPDPLWAPADLQASALRLWEIGSNLKAWLQGPDSVVPLKNIYRGRYGQMTILQRMPAPYFDVDESVVTPHRPWGKPLSGGPVPVAFLMPEIMIRTAIEIRQRLDVTPTWLPFAEEFFGGSSVKDRRGPPVMDSGSQAQLRRYLDRQPDGTLVIPAFEDGSGFFMKEYVVSWNAILPETRLAILQAVRRGLGLVAIGPQFPAPEALRIGAQPVAHLPELLHAVPVPEARARDLLSCALLGQGRIVHVRPAILCGRVRSGFSLGPAFLVPGLVSPGTKRIDEDEYALALCAAAVVWAARRSPQAEVATRDVVRVDRFGRRLDLSAPLTGPTVEETRLLDGAGHVLGWSAQPIGPDKPIGPRVDLPVRVIPAGQSVKATITWTHPAPADAVLAEVVDIYGRTVRQHRGPLRNGKAELEIPPWMPLSRWHDLRIVVQNAGAPVGDALWPFAVDTPLRDRTDLTLWVLPAPTMFIPGMKAAGVTGSWSQRDHFLPFLPDIPPKDRAAVQQWHAHEEVVRSGLEFHESFQWMSIPMGEQEGEAGPADPTAASRMRQNISEQGLAYRILGLRRAITCDEFNLPPHASFRPGTLAAFRRSLRERYGSIDKLNAAWGRQYGAWAEVRPDSFDQAVGRKNLISWMQHRAWMETLVAGWQEEAQRLLQQQVPEAVVGLSNAARGPDTGIDLAKLMRGADMLAQYSYFDTVLPRDLGRPGARLGYWEPITFDQVLPPQATVEALFSVHRYLLEQYASGLIWWGFCDFQWPFLRPDLTPASTFRPALEERKRLSAGIDRIVLGARLADRDVAVLFSQASWRALQGLGRIAGGELPVSHDWAESLRLLESVCLRGHAVASEDLPLGRLARDKSRVLILSGAIALADEHLAAIEAFVDGGGLVVADVLPGTHDEDGALRDPSRMARLFGVSGRLELAKTGPGGKVVGRNAFAPFTESLRAVSPCMPGLTLDGGAAHGTAGETPALIEHQKGKGRTLLMNFMAARALGMAETDPKDAGKRHAAMVAAAQSLTAWAGLDPPVEVSSENPALPPYSGSHVYLYEDQGNRVVGLYSGGWSGGQDRGLRLKTRAEGHLYDLRAPGPPESGREFTVTVPKWQASYLLLSAEPLPPVVTKIAAGEDGDIHVSLSGDHGRRAVLIRVTDPSGRERTELAQEVDFVGQTQVVVPVAVNDPSGEWRLHVRDAVTGDTSEQRVTR